MGKGNGRRVKRISGVEAEAPDHATAARRFHHDNSSCQLPVASALMGPAMPPPPMCLASASPAAGVLHPSTQPVHRAVRRQFRVCTGTGSPT